MTPSEYITLAGKYCERMEWNHDAIPELAKCLEGHDAKLKEAMNEALGFHPDSDTDFVAEIVRLRQESRDNFHALTKAEERNARMRENLNPWMQINSVLFVYARDREIKCLSADEARDNQKRMIADGWKHTSSIHPARWIEALINHPEGLDEESNRLMDELQFGVSTSAER